MTGNKTRLYLAFYSRLPTPKQPVKYHTSFILTPKNPKVTDHITLIHVTNPLDPEVGKQVWKFESKEIIARTGKLAGTMLLGKLSPDITVDNVTDILRTVPVRKADKNWWCHDWILEAIPILVSNGIIPQLPDTPEKTLEVGYSFVEELTGGYLKPDRPVPICNVDGKKLSSEIGPTE